MKLPAALMVALPCAAAFMTPACPPAARYGRDMAVYGSNGRRVDESRRHVLQQALGGAALAGLFLRPNIAGAFPFGDEVGDTLDSIAKDRAKVEEVLVLLKKKELRANADDSAVIFRYIGSVYQPLQETMAKIAPKLKLADEEKQKRAELVPLLLKGHLLELKAAAKATNPEEELEEMEEVAESVDEFLALAATKYSIKSYLQKQDWSYEKDYGVFTCEFFGKDQLPDSNRCVDRGE